MVVERILQFIDYKRISKSEFYRKTGLSNGFLDKVKDIGSSKLELILKAYPEINLKWLVLGEGEMLIVGSVDVISDRDQYIIELQKKNIEFMEIEIDELKKELSSTDSAKKVVGKNL